MELSHELSPPNPGGIFLPEIHKDQVSELLGSYATALTTKQNYKEKLDKVYPKGLEDETAPYQPLVQKYVKSKTAYKKLQESAVISILLPGKENKRQRQRLANLLYGDKRETYKKDRDIASQWIESLDMAEILAEAGVVVEYSPPNPYDEMTIGYVEFLKEKIALSDDLASRIKRQSAEYRQQILEQCKTQNQKGIIFEGRHFETAYYVWNNQYLCEYEYDNNVVIHYYEGQLNSYDRHRNSSIDDDIRIMKALSDCEHNYFTSDSIEV